MQITIQLLSYTETQQPTKSGKMMTMAEVAYKDNGQVKGKKLAEFANKDICRVLKTASAGEQFTITQEKEGDYWQWKSISPAGSAPAVQQSSAPQPSASGTQKLKGDWETREERNLRQLHIIRQSCLSNAVNSLKTEKTTPTSEEVLKRANEYVAWVVSNPEEQVSAAQPVAPWEDLQDDIPL